MPTYSAFKANSQAIKPARVEVLQPTDFADGWARRPKASVAIGLRRLSESEEQGAYQEAAQEASRIASKLEPPDRAERFADVLFESLIRIGVGRAMCDPNDVDRPHALFPMAEDTVGDALRSATLQRLWHALEAVAAETSAVYHEATDAELEALAWAILEGNIRELDQVSEARSRRFGALILGEFPDQAYDSDDKERLDA